MRILLLDLDALRPDHLGCYGYHRDTSPTIDRIAREGVRFNNVYCSDAPCLPSRTALLSGRFGIHTGVVGHGGTAADMRLEGPGRAFQSHLSQSSLPAFLKAQGLHTAYIGGFGERHSVYTFYAGFREIHDTGMGGMESAEHVTPTVLDWIKRRAGDDNWFLHVNYWDPHTPYRAPPAFGNPFAGEPLPDWYTEDRIAAHRTHAGPHSAQDVNMYDNRDGGSAFPRHPGEIRNMKDMRRLVDGYDCAIRYMDGHIADVLAGLEAAGVLDETTVIVTADHGENMGELGIYAEHGTADQATCRIPLIVRRPGGMRGHVDDGLHYHLDLAPTLAEWLQAEPDPSWHGASYAPAVSCGAGCGRDELILSQCAHVCQRSVRFESSLYMRTFHDGYHLFPDEMLFDIEQDPREDHDLSGTRPDVLRDGAARLSAWHDAMMRSMPAGYDVDPMETVLAEGGPYHARGMLKGYCERLEATGRGEHIAELKRRHPHEFNEEGG